MAERLSDALVEMCAESQTPNTLRAMARELQEARAVIWQIREWAIKYDLDAIKELIDSSALLPEET